MPAAASTDVAHTQVTDHRIPRHREGPAQLTEETRAPHPATPRLVPFPDSAEAEQDVRDLALAWQSLANTGMEGAETHAESRLRSAVAEFPNDPDLLTALAYVDQRHGLSAQAQRVVPASAGRKP